MKYNFLLGRLKTVATPWWQHQQRHQQRQHNVVKNSGNKSIIIYAERLRTAAAITQRRWQQCHLLHKGVKIRILTTLTATSMT